MGLLFKETFRLILHLPGNGRENMAVDEALLQRVEQGQSPPVLRLYGFSPPTLSLGRYQRVREKLQPHALERDGVTLVRRPTGGQAVLHDQELTYAVILARVNLEPFRKREIYRFIARLLLSGLRRFGIEAFTSHQREGGLHNPDCFQSTGEYEITIAGGRKLIGSAQLITRDGSLQHGSLPLGASFRKIGDYLDLGLEENYKPPSSICLGEELGREVSFSEAVSAFCEGFRSEVAMTESELTAEERELVRDLLENKYGEDSWNLSY